MQKIKKTTQNKRLSSPMKRNAAFGQWVEEISRIMDETTGIQFPEKGEK